MTDAATSGGWKMNVVRGVIGVFVLAVIFVAGTLYGKHGAGSGHDHAAASSPAEAGAGGEVLYWTCSMHPQVKLSKAGQCPICFMDLIPVRAGDDEDATSPRIKLSQRARELARVETSPVQRKLLTHDVELVGKVAPDETAITQISSYVPGRLDRLFVDYTGILVRKGDHLAEIYSPELLVAQQEYLIALQSIDHNAAAAQSEGLTSSTGNMMLEAARRKLELWGIPRDEIEALAKSRKPSDHMRIDAPQEGWVLERKVYAGMYVETGTPIFTLADLRTLWVLLDAYELDVGLIRPGQDAEFETEAFPGQNFKGRVSYIDPVLNPTTRTVKVRLVVPNKDMKLKPEMFVRAHVHVEVGEGGAVASNNLAGKWICPMHPEVVKDALGKCDKCGMNLEKAESLGYGGNAQVAPALAVPQTAVLLTGQRAVVYVEAEKDGSPIYEGRVIELGPRAGDSYVVKAGLNEGDRVVTRGALMIDSALQIQARPSMMQPPNSGSAETKPAPAKFESHYVPDAMYHDHMAPAIKSYLALTAALAADDPTKSAAAASDLRKALAHAQPHGLNERDVPLFKKQVQAIADSLPKPDQSGLDALRNGLPRLTDAVESYLRTFGHNQPAPLVKAFCPMAFDDKGAFWFQTGETIANPYFGAKMLRCGEVKAKLGTNGGEVK